MDALSRESRQLKTDATRPVAIVTNSRAAAFKHSQHSPRAVCGYTPPATINVVCPEDNSHPLWRVRDIGDAPPARFGYPRGARYKYRGWCPEHGELVAFRDGQGNWVPRPGSQAAARFEYIDGGE
jgi:hypothetical protein